MKSEKKLSENLRTKIRLVLTMLCAVGMILGTVPSTAKAAPGKYMHMHGGAGLTFHFVFQTVSPGDIESIDVPGMDNESGAVPAVYQETGHEIETGDKLLYVKVFDSSGELVGIIQQNAIHERGTGQAEYVMLDDGTMGAPADHGGLIEFNDGTANFWYQGFDVADAAHLTPLKVWEDSEGNPVTDPPTPFNFTLTFYPIPGNVQQVTVAPGKQIGLSKGTYEVSEPDVDGFELKSIVWNTSVGTSTDILGLAARVVAGHADYTVTFTNVESTSPYIQLTIPAQKIADFGVLKDGQFHFAVIDEDDDIVAQATNDAAGNITFKLPRYYAEELDIGDTILNFTVVETSVSKGGWTVGGETYKVAFTITNTSIDETPTATGPVVTDSNGVAVDAITFTNTYAAKGQLSLEATKNANIGLSGGEFEFEILDANDGSVVATATNGADGKISFSAIDYVLNKTQDDTGDHYYKVVEKPTALPLWTSDDTTWNIKVTVTDDGVGKLDTVVTDAETGAPVDISFTNTHITPYTLPWVLSAKKVAVDQDGNAVDLTAGQFSFALEDAEGNVVSEATNGPEGNIFFAEIDYNVPGTYDYTVVETSKSGDGWTCDESVYKVEVVVTENSDHVLSTVTTITDDAGQPVDGITFTNVYTPVEPPINPPKPPNPPTPPRPPIPLTVDSSMLPMLGILGLLIAATALVALRRRTDLMFGSE